MRQPTAQQAAIVSAAVSLLTASKKPRLLKVKACAGSGKTSTCTMVAEALQVPSLYLAFNSVTAKEAAEKFPRHVECKTTHSKAYHAFGKALQHKLKRPVGAYKNVAGTGAEIARYFKMSAIHFPDDMAVSAAWQGLLVKETVACFEQSADAKLTDKHVPMGDLRKKLNDDIGKIGAVKAAVFGIAKKLWAERVDLSSAVLATHDTYLKLFQLSKPVFGGIDVLYVDEFQDTTPCVLDIVMNQAAHMAIIVVGDHRQAIYGWRGAVNAMEMVKGLELGLTKSFRYGQAVADVATAVLEGDLIITGFEKITSVVGLDQVVDRTQPHCRLFRTNSALLFAAVDSIDQGVSTSIETDVKDFVKLLQSAEALYNDQLSKVKHDKLLPFLSWQEVVEESENDPELGRLVKIMAEGLVTRWVSVLEHHVNPTNPLVTFTTAHKSKGREFTQVIVESDFKSGYDAKGKWVGLSTEEQNLLYVACTRAIERLEYNGTTEAYVRRRSVRNHGHLALAA